MSDQYATKWAAEKLEAAGIESIKEWAAVAFVAQSKLIELINELPYIEFPDSSWKQVIIEPPAEVAKCICPRFSDTGGVRIADLCCPDHGC